MDKDANAAVSSFWRRTFRVGDFEGIRALFERLDKSGRLKDLEIPNFINSN